MLLEDFNRDRNPEDYGEEEGSIAYSYPSVIMNVIGKADDENVQVAPYLVVDVTNVRPMTGKVDYVVYRYPGGGAGALKVFAATFAPRRTGVFYAPQATADAVPGTSGDPIVRKPADYYTLTSGEFEAFQLVGFMVPGYYYRFRVGIPYTYQGEESIAWSEDEYVAGIPLKADVWLADYSTMDENTRFERVGDLQDFLETKEKRGEAQPSNYTRNEAAEAIESQNQEVREYIYPYTPPQQIDSAGE